MMNATEILTVHIERSAASLDVQFHEARLEAPSSSLLLRFL